MVGAGAKMVVLTQLPEPAVHLGTGDRAAGGVEGLFKGFHGMQGESADFHFLGAARRDRQTGLDFPREIRMVGENPQVTEHLGEFVVGESGQPFKVGKSAPATAGKSRRQIGDKNLARFQK